MWKDKLNKRVIGKDQIENESLFNQFLIMLGKMLPLAEKSIKGRIFSKFHERKMKSLTEVGFVNFTSLFMVMTLTGGTQTDTVNKLSDLYSMLSFTPKFLNTVIKGMLGILLIIHTSKIDNIEFTKEIGQTFGKVCTWFLESNNRNEPGVHHQLWTVMCTYMDGVQEILDLGPISAGVAPLIPGHMADALEGSSGNNEMIRILQFVQTVMHKVRNREEAINQLVSLDSYTEIARILWTSVFPFVKTHSTTLTPPEILADVATSFTLLAQDSPPPASSGIKENVSSLFNYFSINENVNGLFSCRYMCHLIPHGLLFPQNDTLLQAWIRCCLLIPDDSSEQFTELTRLIFTSGAMKDFVTSQVDPSPKVCFLHFLKSIQEGYENAVKEGLLHKTNYREKVFNLFSNMNKYVIPPLRTPSGSHICHVYTMCGHIISRCGSALYLQSRADSPLPPLIKSLILPRVIYDGNKVLHSALLAAMKDTIHMYVTGLASIKMDPYIERCIRDIFKHYMKRFPLRSSSGGGGSLHPLVNCLRLMPASVRKLIYETVLSNFTQPDSSTAWMFLSEAFVTNPPQVTSEDCKYVMNTLLYNYIVIKQQQIEEIMQKLLRVLHKNGTDLDKNQTADVMKEFIVQHFKAYSIRLLKVLDLLSNWCPSVLCLLIQTLTEVILYTETNRGIDTQLREKYYCILRKLGNEGQVEISRLTS
ncbi:protein MMS22-like [Tubulanus polymorphus]|uniref:protein MMS22-like n=1 Tax=Tubulanus polymorphus TaxID=672921 RepID=UPI003DA573B4